MIFCDQCYCRVCFRQCIERIQVSFLTLKNSHGFTLYKVCFSAVEREKALDYFSRFSISDSYKGFEVIPGSVLMVENGRVSLPFILEGGDSDGH